MVTYDNSTLKTYAQNNKDKAGPYTSPLLPNIPVDIEGNFDFNFYARKNEWLYEHGLAKMPTPITTQTHTKSALNKYLLKIYYYLRSNLVHIFNHLYRGVSIFNYSDLLNLFRKPNIVNYLNNMPHQNAMMAYDSQTGMFVLITKKFAHRWSLYFIQANLNKYTISLKKFKGPFYLNILTADSDKDYKNIIDFIRDFIWINPYTSNILQTEINR